jgi:hypothetical protein
MRSSNLQIRASFGLLVIWRRLHELVIPWDSTMSSSIYHRRRVPDDPFRSPGVISLNGSIDPPTTDAWRDFFTRV